MNAKVIFAVLLAFAAVPASHAEYFGRGSENPPSASKPVLRRRHDGGSSTDEQAATWTGWQRRRVKSRSGSRHRWIRPAGLEFAPVRREEKHPVPCAGCFFAL